MLWLLVALAWADPRVISVRSDGAYAGDVPLTPDLQTGCRGWASALRGATGVEIALEEDAVASGVDCAVKAAEAAGFAEVTLRADRRTVAISTRCPAEARPYAWALDGSGAVVERETAVADLRFPAVRFDLGHAESVALAREVRLREPRVAHLRVAASAPAFWAVAAAQVASLDEPVRAEPASAPPAIPVDRAMWGGGDIVLRQTGGAWVRLPPEAVQAERWCVGDDCAWELSTAMRRYALGPAVGDPPFGLPAPTRQTEVLRPRGTATPPSAPAAGGTSDLGVCWEGVSFSTTRAGQAWAVASDPRGPLRGCVARLRKPIPGSVRLVALVDRAGRLLDVALRGSPGPAQLDACTLAALRHVQLPPGDDGVTVVPFVWTIPEPPDPRWR